MPGGLGSLLLFIKNGLGKVKKYLFTSIQGTSTFKQAKLYNYLADKKMTAESIISDDIPIAIPIVPGPIHETVPPTPIEPVFEPIIVPPVIPPVQPSIAKSYIQLTVPISPGKITKSKKRL
jgi:hypothetical protein